MSGHFLGLAIKTRCDKSHLDVTDRSILLLIDVEPDPRKTRGDADEWAGSCKALSYLDALRTRIEKRTHRKVLFNWFIRADPQIEKTWGRADWVCKACPQLMRTIKEHGDGCGIHPHLWRWDASRFEWFNDFSDPNWVLECLHTAIRGFERIFDSSPEMCRFGDRWLNQNAIELMRAFGIKYDFTLEPGLPEEPVFDDPHATGWLPDYRNAPREPYHPSKENFLFPDLTDADGNPLWMVPLTTTATFWKLIRRRPYLIKTSYSPNLSLPLSYVWPHLKSQLAVKTKLPLVIVLRTGDLGKTTCLENFLHTAEQLLNEPRITNCEFTRPENATEKWQDPRLRGRYDSEKAVTHERRDTLFLC